MSYEKLPLAAQTQLANITDMAFESYLNKSINDLTGSFSNRSVAGKSYWYYQFKDPVLNKNIQIFLGKESPRLNALIEQKQNSNEHNAQKRKSIQSARIFGARSIAAQHFNLIKRFSDYGFFHAGAVLIGSHAFMAYENMFGIKWKNVAYTSDVDFAHAGKSISLLLPSNLQVNMTDAIDSLNAGFLPQVSIDGQLGARWQHPKEKDFFIDFLTPKTSDNDEPILNKQLGISLQPLKFMEYSLEDIEQSILLSRTDAIVVNVPNPARFAMHKVLIQGERKGRDSIKSNKDLLQAKALIEYLETNRPYDLLVAYEDIVGKGPGWRKRFSIGSKALENLYQLDLKKIIDDIKENEGNINTLAWREGRE